MSVIRRASPETLRMLKAIRDALSAHAIRRGDRLEVRYKVGWVSLRSVAANRSFAEVRPGKRGIEIFLLPPRSALRDPRGLAQPVPPSRGWGWFRSRAKMEDGASAGVAADLLRQSYECARQMPGRRRNAL